MSLQKFLFFTICPGGWCNQFSRWKSIKINSFAFLLNPMKKHFSIFNFQFPRILKYVWGKLPLSTIEHTCHYPSEGVPLGPAILNNMRAWNNARSYVNICFKSIKGIKKQKASNKVREKIKVHYHAFPEHANLQTPPLMESFLFDFFSF